MYSTNPNYNFEEENKAVETILPHQQELKVSIDRKQRKGKSVTLISGFVGSNEDLKELAKILKSKCGVGGSAKNNEIIVQGEFKEKIYTILNELGYHNTKKIGG